MPKFEQWINEGANTAELRYTDSLSAPGLARLNAARDALLAAEFSAGLKSPSNTDRLDRADRRIAQLEDDLRRSREALAASRIEAYRAEAETRKAVVANDSLVARIQQLERYQGGSSLDAEMVRRLIQLCHPDRNGNSEASRKATAYLLSQKR